MKNLASEIKQNSPVGRKTQMLARINSGEKKTPQ